MKKATLKDSIRIESNLKPVDIFDKLWQIPYSSLLDSSLNNTDEGRYSFIGIDPLLVIQSKSKKNTIMYRDKEPIIIYESPFEILRQKLAEIGSKFQNGSVIGYFSYDLCQEVENLPNAAQDDLNLPDMLICFYDSLITYDHNNNTYSTSTTNTNLVSMLKNHQFKTKSTEKKRISYQRQDVSYLKNEFINYFSCNQDKSSYLRSVKKIISQIHNGDVYQVNYSQRFEVNTDQNPWNTYKKLRSNCPTFYSGFMNCGNYFLLSSSPESFLNVQNNKVVTKPIKGTRPRGISKKDDDLLSLELLNCKKEIAENTMIVDVERNDLGRVCKIGTVKVEKLCSLEKYDNVMHLVSTVKGDLEKNKDIVDILKATFPGGSITGAPKIRSMEIIEQLEPTKRGPYTGSMGIIDFKGNANLNILIRTILIKNKTAYFQVGGGIVADSDPEKEYQETLDKGSAMFSALM